ncbi:hypothetical protein ANO11243_083320 [Dothideomycetidae sp. 11243]|nr:hypothetical protein ANO11243_083320 [fungal sp. No.11243]
MGLIQSGTRAGECRELWSWNPPWRWHPLGHDARTLLLRKEQKGRARTPALGRCDRFRQRLPKAQKRRQVDLCVPLLARHRCRASSFFTHQPALCTRGSSHALFLPGDSDGDGDGWAEPVEEQHRTAGWQCCRKPMRSSAAPMTHDPPRYSTPSAPRPLHTLLAAAQAALVGATTPPRAAANLRHYAAGGKSEFAPSPFPQLYISTSGKLLSRAMLGVNAAAHTLANRSAGSRVS